MVKCGGHGAVDVDAVTADVAHVHQQGHRVVLVHGGSADVDRLSERLGVVPQRIVAPDGVSTRHTDAATLEVLQLALGGLTKPRIVSALARSGAQAVGLTGLDAGLLTARRKKAHRAVVDGRTVVVRDNHSGRVVGVNTGLLEGVLEGGIIPVVSPPAMAEDGRPVNTDADRAAAAVASALGADELIMLTGAPGVLADASDETTAYDSYALVGGDVPLGFGGGMAMKLVASAEALSAGIDRVVIADGRIERPLTTALAGRGGTTVTTRGVEEAS